MKTIKSILTVTAITTLFTASAFAAEPLLTPRAAASAHKVVAGEVMDANSVDSSTITGSGAKAKYAGNRVVVSSRENPNLLAETKCPMAPKAKGTAECKKMCDVAGIK